MKQIIERPTFAVIFFAIVVLLGAVSFFKTPPIELVPDAELPELTVSYRWAGASPDLILRKVLMPAEEEIVQIKGVSKITSDAFVDRGSIKVEFTRDTRMNFAEVLLSERLNKLQKSLPQQVQKPRVTTYKPREFEQKPLLTIGVLAKNYSIFSLRKIAEKEVEPYLKSIPGVDDVDLLGGVEPEIKIRTNQNKLKKLGISIWFIYQKIYENFYSIQSIALKKDAKEITLTLSRNPQTIQDIQEILVTKQGEKKIFLKDVADVYFGYQELQFDMRFKGHSVIGFRIYKEQNQNAFLMSKRVKTKLQALATRLKGQVEFVIQEDESKDLRENLTKLLEIAGLILIIIFLVLLIIFRDFKVSLLTFSSVFFSVFTTFTVIYLLKIPMNLLTLSGLALGFGLFVDNSVVVFDSIARFREKGYNRRDSAIEGAKAMLLPVLSSTLTTIIVFFSFAIFEGRLRVYYLPLAYVIAISLASSVVVSFVLIPSLSARINFKIKKKKKVFSRGKLYPFILRYPVIVIVPVILLGLFSFFKFQKEVSFGSFFSFSQREQLVVAIWFTSNVEFEDVKEAILKFETIAVAKPYNKEVTTYIQGGRRSATMLVNFPKDIEASALPLQLKQEMVGLATNLAGVGVWINGFDQEPYHYNPDTRSFLAYSIQIKGYNYEKLMKVSNELKKNLLNHRKIKEVEIDTTAQFRGGGTEKYYSFRLNRLKMKKYRIATPRNILLQISSLIREKTSINKLKLDDKELSVEIKVYDVNDIELDDISNREFKTAEGIPFRIKDVVDIELTKQKGGISREDQEYMAFVKWDYLGSDKAADKFHKTLYKNLLVPAGFKKSLEEKKWRMTEEEQSQLWKAIILAIGLIILILGMLYDNFFQPFLIILSIPLALIGMWLAFVILDFNFDSKAYIGVILMGGIVVNNAILLVDNMNRHLSQGKELISAIIIGAKERIRPILITSLTTILGMLPLVIGVKKTAGGKTDIWSSLALCTVGGLTTSALLLLFVLPILYYLFAKFQKHVAGRIKNNNSPSIT